MYSKLVASFGQQQKFTYHVPFLIQGLSKCFVRPKSSPVMRNYNFSHASISFLLKISGKVARNFHFGDIWFIHISSVHCQIYFWNLQSYKCLWCEFLAIRNIFSEGHAYELCLIIIDKVITHIKSNTIQVFKKKLFFLKFGSNFYTSPISLGKFKTV